MLKGDFNLTELKILKACTDDFLTGKEISRVTELPYSTVMRAVGKLAHNDRYMITEMLDSKSKRFRTKHSLGIEPDSGPVKIRGNTLDDLIQSFTNPRSMLNAFGYDLSGILCQMGSINQHKLFGDELPYGSANAEELRLYLRGMITNAELLISIMLEIYKDKRIWKTDGSLLDNFVAFDMARYSGNTQMFWRDLAWYVSERIRFYDATTGKFLVKHKDCPMYPNPTSVE